MSRVCALRFAALTTIALSLASCGDERPGQRGGGDGRGGGDVVATIGAVSIRKALVGDVATSRGLSTRDALTALVGDALLSQEAQSRHLDGDRHDLQKIKAIHARTVLRLLHAEAGPSKPLTQEELDGFSQAQWADVDRSEALFVTHAVVLTAKYDGSDADAGAATTGPDGGSSDRPTDQTRREVAQAIHDAVRGTSTPEEFEARAKAVPSRGLKVTIERLPAFDDRGRMMEGEGLLDEGFTRGAFAIKQPETLSPVVESGFGYHVILVLRRLPPVHLTLEERKRKFALPAFERRARKAVEAHVAELKKETPIEISSAADSDMTQVMSLFH